MALWYKKNKAVKPPTSLKEAFHNGLELRFKTGRREYGLFVNEDGTLSIFTRPDCLRVESKLSIELLKVSYGAKLPFKAPSSKPKPVVPAWVRQLCGEYTASPLPLKEMWSASGTKLSFSRWLTYNGISEKSIKEIISRDKLEKYTLSCRPSDILRCSDTKHFESCLRSAEYAKLVKKEEGAHRSSVKQYHTIKNLCVLFVRDKGGYFSGRVFVNIVKSTDGKILLFPARFYGEGCEGALHDLAEKLEAKIVSMTYNIVRKLNPNDVYFDTGDSGYVFPKWEKEIVL